MEFHHVCRTDPKRPRLADCTAGKEFTQHTVRHLALKKTSYYVVLQRNIYRNHAKGNIGLNFFDEVVRKKRKNLIYLWKFQFICCVDDSSGQTKIQKNPAIKDWIIENKKWSGRLDSNQRPLRPERSAPTRLSYAPTFIRN